MPQTFGTPTKTKILKIESHKLMVEFEAAAAIKAGQEVKLTAVGKVTPMIADDEQQLSIGIALFDAAVDEPVTIATRGFALINAESADALIPGPVRYAGYNATTDLSQYTDGTVTGAVATAWALDVADGANDPIRVLLKN
jgi:hypothetical protein